MNKIDLIIDALDCAKQQTIKGVMYPAGYHMMLAQALAAARELRELKPVAWMYINDDDECEQIEFGQPHEEDMSFTTALYALEVTK